MGSRLGWWLIAGVVASGCGGSSKTHTPPGDGCRGCEAGAAGTENTAEGGGSGTSAGADALAGSDSGGGGTAQRGGSSGSSGSSASGGNAGGSAGSEAAGAAGDPSEGGTAGESPVAACEPGATRCLSQREICSSEGQWVQGDESCTIALAGSSEGGLMCALRADGRVTCFGGSGERLLDSIGPLPSLAGAVALSVADEPDEAQLALCVTTADPKLYCQSVHTVREFERVHAGTTGMYGTCFADGTTIRCEGSLVWEVPASGGITKLVMGNEKVYALGADGSLSTLNFFDAFREDRYIDVATNGVGACAVREVGPIECVPDIPAPDALQVPYRRVALEFGGRVCGIRREGTIACWSTPESEPFIAPEGLFTEIAATWGGMCAVRTDGSIACFGDEEFSVPAGW